MGRWKKLDKMDLLPPIKEEAEYRERLEAGQKQLLRIQQWCARTGCRVILAIEGWDAAGKGGLIQRLTHELDRRPLSVWSIGAPTAEEQGRHYLWRFWQKLPAPGEIAIFDRTWYGRVLVERIEGYCTRDAWKRAYDEINAFEQQLVDDGVRMVKLLLHTSEEEQKARIIERMEKPVKRFKVTLDDFRNIAKRKEYLDAFDDMLERTDTQHAPWTVIPTDHKWRARVEAIETVVKVLSKNAALEPLPLDPAIADAARKLWGWKPSKVKVGG
jgi:AMP-polyphosphate phosphotransferase